MSLMPAMPFRCVSILEHISTLPSVFVRASLRNEQAQQASVVAKTQESSGGNPFGVEVVFLENSWIWEGSEENSLHEPRLEIQKAHDTSSAWSAGCTNLGGKLASKCPNL